MAKQDVLDAINATIIENGQKGITAQALNNVLTMMTENAGEGGSGDGALRVIVPEMQMFGREIVNSGELSPASWEAMKSQMEAGTGFDLSEYDAVVNASFAHNADVAQQILDKARAGQGVSVVLDQTPYSSTLTSIIFQEQPDMEASIEEAVMGGVQPTGLSLQYMKSTPEGEALLGRNLFACMLVPTGYINDDTDSGIVNYPSDMIITLNLDGSLTFTVLEEEQPTSGSGVVTFYMLGGGAVQDDTTKAMNKKSYDAFWAYDGLPAVNILVIVGESYTKNDGFEAMYPIVAGGNPNEDLILATSAIQFAISSDGNMVLSDIPIA